MIFVYEGNDEMRGSDEDEASLNDSFILMYNTNVRLQVLKNL